MTEEHQRRAARNDAMAEHDHAPLRAAITAIVRETSLCPEDMSQMAVGRQWLLDKLPADVRPRVVWREKLRLPNSLDIAGINM